MTPALWFLGDKIAWTTGGITHSGTIVAFCEPDGIWARSCERDPIYRGGDVRVGWCDVRRAGRSPESAHAPNAPNAPNGEK